MHRMQRHVEVRALHFLPADHFPGSARYCLRCAVGKERSKWWRQDHYHCVLCKAKKARNDFAIEDLKNEGSSGPRACEQCKELLCTLCKIRPDKKEYQQWARVKKNDTDEPPAFVCMTCKYPPCDICKVVPRPMRQLAYSVERPPKRSCNACR